MCDRSAPCRRSRGRTHAWRPRRRATSRTHRTRRFRRCTRRTAALRCWPRRRPAARRDRVRRRARGTRVPPVPDRCSARTARARPARAVGDAPSATPRTSSRFEAGSVLTSSTRFPASARAMAVAQAADVLPTPPLPVKKRMRVGCSMRVDMMAFSSSYRSSSTYFVRFIRCRCAATASRRLQHDPSGIRLAWRPDQQRQPIQRAQRATDTRRCS